MDQSQLDIAGLNLKDDTPVEVVPEEPAKPPAAVEKLIEEAKAAIAEQVKSEKRSLSLVVVGESCLVSHSRPDDRVADQTHRAR